MADETTRKDETLDSPSPETAAPDTPAESAAQPAAANEEPAEAGEKPADREGKFQGPSSGSAAPAVDTEAVESDLDQLVEITRERDEYLDLAQRTKADFENFRKRAASERASAVVKGRIEVAEGVIACLDNLERSMQADGLDPLDALREMPEGASVAQQGVVVAYRDLNGALDKAGIEAYWPIEESFDPNLHEALSAAPAQGTLPGQIIEVLQRGYRLDDHVIRPARVVVSQ